MKERMSYTLMPGDTVPDFNPLVSTDRFSYNLDSLPLRPFNVVFLHAIIVLMSLDQMSLQENW